MARDRFSQRREGGVETIQGSFGPNGAGALDVTKVKGHGFTVAHSGAGAFTVTLLDVYLSAVDLECSLQLGAAAAVRVLIGVVNLSAKTIQILVTDMDGTTLSDAIISAAGSRINFNFSLKRTSSI